MCHTGLRRMRTLLVLCSFSLIARAQQSQVAQTPPPSVAPEWDVSKVVTAFSDQAGRLKPILDQLNPKEWVSKGAPEAYVSQWQTAEQELTYVTQSAKN